jgi:hypothetical protein
VPLPGERFEEAIGRQPPDRLEAVGDGDRPVVGAVKDGDRNVDRVSDGFERPPVQVGEEPPVDPPTVLELVATLSLDVTAVSVQSAAVRDGRSGHDGDDSFLPWSRVQGDRAAETRP